MSAGGAGGCLGCQRCEDGPVVTLIDGRVVCNYCPDYKDECLARHVLSMPSKTDRRRFLVRWGEKHGEAEGARLGELVKAVWAHNRGHA